MDVTALGLALRLVLGRKIEAYAVDAVPLIGRRRVPLSLKDVTQVAAAVGADNLGPDHAESTIFVTGDRARNAVKVGRPAAARLELVVGLVEWRGTTGAGVDALFGVVLVELAGARGLGAFFAEDAKLICSESVAYSKMMMDESLLERKCE